MFLTDKIARKTFLCGRAILSHKKRLLFEIYLPIKMFSKVFVLNKLDKIYKRQLSFHQAQLDRYAKAAELRRTSGQHQQDINKLGQRWQQTINKVKTGNVFRKNKENGARKMSLIDVTYQREMR